MKAQISLADVDSLKAELGRILPDVKSSHRVEAMARGLGWDTNAALRSALADSSARCSVDCHAFTGYLKEHGFTETRYDALEEAVVRCQYGDVRATIESVMASQPLLSSNGFRHDDWRKPPHEQEADFLAYRRDMLTSASVDEFMRACEYLEQAGRRDTVNKTCTSYGWKHEAERFHKARGPGNPYVANGMFIAAALHLGFLVKPIKDSPNAYVNIASEEQQRDNGASKLAKYVGGKTRLAAWRNMMVAAINAGLDQGLFGLDVDDNRWNGEFGIYRFDFAGMPAIASVRDVGFGELSIHVAVRPTKDAERAIRSANAGFYAGDAFAAGWLEREKGKWLQSSTNPATAFRRDLLAMISAMAVEPKGFRSDGRFMM